MKWTTIRYLRTISCANGKIFEILFRFIRVRRKSYENLTGNFKRNLFFDLVGIGDGSKPAGAICTADVLYGCVSIKGGLCDAPYDQL